MGEWNGQLGPKKAILVCITHAGAVMKQRVRYRGGDLTTGIEHEVGDERRTRGENGAKRRSGENQDGKA